MAYTVRKLLESEQFPKMKLLCGKKGLDREVTQVFDKDTARFLFQSMSLCTEQRKERGEHLCSLQIQRIMRARSKLTWRYKHEWDTQ